MARGRPAPIANDRCSECGGALNPDDHFWVDAAPGRQCSRSCAASTVMRGQRAVIHHVTKVVPPLFRATAKS